MTHSSRFAQCSNEEMKKDTEERIHLNTRKKCQWAMNILKTWFQEYQIRKSVEPRQLIESLSVGELNNYLQVFVCEVRCFIYFIYDLFVESVCFSGEKGEWRKVSSKNF